VNAGSVQHFGGRSNMGSDTTGYDVALTTKTDGTYSAILTPLTFAGHGGTLNDADDVITKGPAVALQCGKLNVRK
jgi:hypothetical protein